MIADFEWTDERCKAAELLAEGRTQQEVADEIGVNVKTIYNWKQESAFSVEVDRLTLTRALASRAERVRIATRMLKKKVESGAIEDLESAKDPIDILKFIQSETNGAICSVPELQQLAAILAGNPPATGSGSEATTAADPSAAGADSGSTGS